MRVTISIDDGPPVAVVFSHPPQGTRMVRRFLAAMQRGLLADPAETVHFHAAEGQPAVCYDADCTSPRLDVS
jgi:hypothetical protein